MGMARTQKEPVVQDQFRACLESPAGGRTRIHKLHGNMFQNGLPDLLCTAVDGYQFWAEMKAAWRHKVKTYRDAVALLRDGTKHSLQFTVFMEWGVRQVPYYIVIGDCHEDDPKMAWTTMWAGSIREDGWEERALRWASLEDVARHVAARRAPTT